MDSNIFTFGGIILTIALFYGFVRWIYKINRTDNPLILDHKRRALRSINWACGLMLSIVLLTAIAWKVVFWLMGNG